MLATTKMNNNNDINLVELKKRQASIKNNLTTKISLANSAKEKLTEQANFVRARVEAYFKSVLEHIVTNKQRPLEFQLEKIFRGVQDRVDEVVSEAQRTLNDLDKQIADYECLLELETNNENMKTEETYLDALMINESVVNEFDINNNENEISKKTSRNSEKLRAYENHFRELCNGQTVLDSLIEEIIDTNKGSLKQLVSFNECRPDLNNNCFGHFDYFDNGKLKLQPSLLVQPLEQLTHMHFSMSSKLNEETCFRLDDTINIEFSCAFSQNERAEAIFNEEIANFHDYLYIDVNDAQQSPVRFRFREKFAETRRLMRITLEPKINPGIYKLSIRYKGVHIPDSPFYFSIQSGSKQQQYHLQQSDASSTVVTTPKPLTSISRENSAPFTLKMHSQASVYSVRSSAALNESKEVVTINNEDSQQLDMASLQAKMRSTPSFGRVPAIGRGRLFNKLQTKKLKDKFEIERNNLISSIGGAEMNGSGGKNGSKKSIELLMCQSLKRPNNNNSSVLSTSTDYDMAEISSKLQKVVYVDEQSQGETVSKNDLARISSFMPAKQCVLSLHLSKYLNKMVGANKQIPSLKGVFLMKFADELKFPIGVCSSHLRDLLFICDTGNDAVKVVSMTTGNLVAKLDKQSNIYFKRPSSILVHDEDSELYVKDDKEIFVFDLSNDFKLIRQFGKLNRPYGLVFDSKSNLIVVQEDIKGSKLMTYDRRNGTLINTKLYQPGIQKTASSSLLCELYGREQSVLSNNVQPFEKMKLRFTACRDDVLYTSDLGRSIIYKTNLEGEIDLAFGHFGKRMGEFNEPSGLHVSVDGQAIVVGDSKNNRLQVYGSNGRYLFDIDLNEKISRPSGIFLDDYGNLYVTNLLSHSVNKYKLVSN